MYKLDDQAAIIKNNVTCYVNVNDKAFSIKFQRMLIQYHEAILNNKLKKSGKVLPLKLFRVI